MNHPINPYQPPQIVEAVIAPLEAQTQWVWREGNTLIMSKQAQLPPICVKCGEPIQHWLKRGLQWHPPAVYFALLLGLLPYLIVALLLMKVATIYVGLCASCRTRRRNAIVLSWILVFGSAFVFISGVVITGDRQNESIGLFVMLGAVVLFIATLFYAVLRTRTVSAKRISNRFVWLRGVHRDMLDRLPEWPRYE